MVFQLNSNDYTKYLQDDSYSINQVDIGETWTDANFKTHYNKVLKVQGSFDMAFITDTDYNSFLNDIESATNNDGNVECTLHVINLNTTATIECNLTISPNRFRPVNSTYAVNIITVDINEA